MAMPLKNVYKDTNSHGNIYIMDGDKYLLTLHPSNYNSEAEAHRIADTIVELLGNHGANDDTTGLYDDEL